MRTRNLGRTGCGTTIATNADRDRAFLATSALAFLLSAGVTIYWCGPMSEGMPMPGGWTMCMAWMRMPGQTWPGSAASFMGGRNGNSNAAGTNLVAGNRRSETRGPPGDTDSASVCTAVCAARG